MPKEKGLHPNIRQIARRLGLSHTTVSLALRGHPRISAGTRRRVQAAAEDLGYRPNALVSALMRQVRSNRRIVSNETVAFLTGGNTPDHWRRHRTIVENFEGAKAQAEALGFKLEPFWLGPRGRDAQAGAKILHTRSIRGAILAPLPVPHESIALDWDHTAVVAVGYSFTQMPLHRAAHHHVNGMLTLYRELRALGYRRIGLAMTTQDMVRVQHYWLAGLLAGQYVFGGLPIVPLTFQDSSEKQKLFEWREANQPDVIASIGWDVYRWLQEKRIRIPSDVAFAHLGLDGAYGGVAGIDQNSKSIGAAAMDLLVGQLYRNEYYVPKQPKIMLLDGEWVSGRTAPRLV
ncbi:MAG TPA: LacI family DNA-binding transcriptional regulator [Opitutaceae bacterium]|nr:LacI family DNA-binding transcriptional regulator [Opitutaceae bacterium]